MRACVGRGHEDGTAAGVQKFRQPKGGGGSLLGTSLMVLLIKLIAFGGSYFRGQIKGNTA